MKSDSKIKPKVVRMTGWQTKACPDDTMTTMLNIMVSRNLFVKGLK